MNKRVAGIWVCVAALSSSLSYAATTSVDSRLFDTKAYIGLKWALNGSYTPLLVLGVIKGRGRFRWRYARG